ncbi:MAG TPA: hypothetical protein VF045_06705, partial [Acidimicrobiales bacterium]
MKTEEAVRSTDTGPMDTGVAPPVLDAIRQAQGWATGQRERGTLVGDETLWREAYSVYRGSADGSDPAAWACIASEVVFGTGKVPLNRRVAAQEACRSLMDEPDRPLGEHARRFERIAERHDVEAGQTRALLGPGIGYPWVFPRELWQWDTVAGGLEAILAPFDWADGCRPDRDWVDANARDRSPAALVAGLQACAPHDSSLGRMLASCESLLRALADEGRDVCVVEAQSFLGGLAGHGLSDTEVGEWRRRLLQLREAVLLLESFQQYRRAERLVNAAAAVTETDPEAGVSFLTKAAGIYQRMAVAQMYPERLLARHQELSRSLEEARASAGLPDERSDQVLLVSTFQSPGDLQRLLLSVTQELQAYGFGRNVHVVVSDDSTEDARATNRRLFAEAARIGLSVSDWGTDRRGQLLDDLNREVFPDGNFDVRQLAGPRMPGEKGVPYGRLRNFLRLAGMVEIEGQGFERPVFTWLDQDNELGALVLTRAGTLAKRHVFNYFDQKSSIFADPDLRVGGGGYTNDALEGVEKFWVAWGIMHTALGLAQEYPPQGPAVLPPDADITRFRPWDQADTLERLPREGEEVETMSDQFLLLLQTLVGTFRGKYDNQVQIYHPWTAGYVDPGREHLVEEMRPFAGMPGGNTSFTDEVLTSSIPFITVGGRGEDIFHLWQLEGRHGPGSIFLTHTPVLHTRNVNGGRGDLMAEIVDSFNGRIFREPPYLWAALANLSAGSDAPPGPEVVAATEERISGLRNEAKASISAVSGFASSLEPYLDGTSEFWWLARAQEDPRCAEVLDMLKSVVAQYKDVEKYHGVADEKLLDFEDVEELTAEFMAAYPHWETVVSHVAGGRPTKAAAPVTTAFGPGEGYGAPLRTERSSASVVPTGATWAEPPDGGEPAEEPPWREVVTASLLLHRRYESGVASGDSWLTWDDRVAQLRRNFAHYAAGVDDVPAFVWTLLFRDALLVPHSPAYRAVSELVIDPARPTSELARHYGVDEAMLADALA